MAIAGSTNPPVPLNPLLLIGFNPADWSLSLTLSPWLAALVILAAVGLFLWRQRSGRWPDLEIDQAEIGVGSQKIRLKPNVTDRQLAYAIWVELTTRKIGIKIDFDHDVIIEIYDSWYNYFTVTREMIKGVTVTQMTKGSTQEIVNLAIAVLNDGLRPHLTKWQARFRNWYSRQVKKYEGAEDSKVIDPQEIQKEFPRFDELRKDMEDVNARLIAYRAKMQEIVFGRSLGPIPPKIDR